MKTKTFLLAVTLIFTAIVDDATAGTLELLDGSTVSVEQYEESVAAISERAGVSGLSVAIINGSQVVYVNGFGVRSRETGEPVNDKTIFAAASFSKTAFAYLVMLLAEEA